MSEVSTEQINEVSPEDSAKGRKRRDSARLKKIGLKHAAAVLATLTLWGAADVWATESGLLIAEIVALLNAVFAGTVIAYLAHEWGHFSGARLSKAVSPVLKQPESFFMFNFKDELNSEGQFLTMSMGGPAANWTLAIIVFFMLPLDTWSQALIFATVTSIAVSVSVFEFPIINRVAYGASPKETVDQRKKESGMTPRYIGIAVGFVVWLIAI